MCFRATGVKQGDLFSLANLALEQIHTPANRKYTEMVMLLGTRRIPDDPSMIWTNVGSEMSIDLIS